VVLCWVVSGVGLGCAVVGGGICAAAMDVFQLGTHAPAQRERKKETDARTGAVSEDPDDLEEARGMVRVRAGDKGRPQVGPQEDHAPVCDT
jgi:hypothetical protein